MELKLRSVVWGRRRSVRISMWFWGVSVNFPFNTSRVERGIVPLRHPLQIWFICIDINLRLSLFFLLLSLTRAALLSVDPLAFISVILIFSSGWFESNFYHPLVIQNDSPSHSRCLVVFEGTPPACSRLFFYTVLTTPAAASACRLWNLCVFS